MRFRRCPGKVERDFHRPGGPYVLTEEQEAWFRRWFPTIENSRLARSMGISQNTLHVFARRFGLKKSEKGMAGIRSRQAIAAKKTCERNGFYASIRGKKPCEATRIGTAKMWLEVREGKREHPFLIMKRERPERYAQMLENRSKERRERIRKERLRLLYCLDKKTRLYTPLTPYKHSQTSHRLNALKRGYFVAQDCREGSPDRYVIFYDDDTERSEQFEKNCIKDGFTFKYCNDQ